MLLLYLTEAGETRTNHLENQHFSTLGLTPSMVSLSASAVVDLSLPRTTERFQRQPGSTLESAHRDHFLKC
jgi:hypothetical protein